MATKVTQSDKDWQWRRKVRSNPQAHRVYRTLVAVAGATVVCLGIIALPFPGPGWLIIFLGLGIWASEFEWAQSLLHWVRRKVQAWWDWLECQNLLVKALAGLLTFAVVLAIFWALFAISGVPTWFPEFVKGPLGRVPGLS